VQQGHDEQGQADGLHGRGHREKRGLSVIGLCS
jgi:hypothetical protein